MQTPHCGRLWITGKKGPFRAFSQCKLGEAGHYPIVYVKKKKGSVITQSQNGNPDLSNSAPLIVTKQ